MFVYLEVIHVGLICQEDEVTSVWLLCQQYSHCYHHLHCQNHDQNINNILGVCTLVVQVMNQSNPLMLTKSPVDPITRSDSPK